MDDDQKLNKFLKIFKTVNKADQLTGERYQSEKILMTEKSDEIFAQIGLY